MRESLYFSLARTKEDKKHFNIKKNEMPLGENAKKWFLVSVLYRPR